MASSFHFCLSQPGWSSLTSVDPFKEQALGFIDFFFPSASPPPLSSVIFCYIYIFSFYLPACYLKLFSLWFPEMAARATYFGSFLLSNVCVNAVNGCQAGQPQRASTSKLDVHLLLLRLCL